MFGVLRKELHVLSLRLLLVLPPPKFWFFLFVDAAVAVRAAQAVLTLFFALSLSALHKAISLQAAADASIAVIASKNQVDASSNMLLTRHQQSLLGLSGSGNRKSLLSKGTELVSELKSLGDVRLRPSRMNGSPSKPASSPPHALMVPLHPVQTKGNRSTSAADSGFLSLLAGPVSSMSPASTLTNPKSSYSSQVIAGTIMKGCRGLCSN